MVVPLMQQAIDDVEEESPLLANMVRYHLGWIDESFSVPTKPFSSGKRIRPLIGLLSCRAVSGSSVAAIPAAAAIEMFHNFTLVHDDIQDHSPMRRHRPTVWKLWGIAQAINVGDSMFANSQKLLLKSATKGVPAQTTIEMIDQFNTVASEIVAGQSLDLAFESNNNVTPADYMAMIRRKTAVLLGFAAWAGARAGGSSESSAVALQRFGTELGLSFQIRDDLLGIWGESAKTGKAAGDDIRRKKKSLPILLLRSHASKSEITRIDSLYASPEIDRDGVNEILDFLECYEVRNAIEEEIERHHQNALRGLHNALSEFEEGVVSAELETLTNALLYREH